MGKCEMSVLPCLLLATVEFAAPFTDHMVLQRRMKVPVWGRAAAGETVEVSFAGRKLGTVADKAGRWWVDLAPMESCGEGRVLTANDKAVSDILVGEVWLCAGQSNMGVSFCGSPHFSDRLGATVAQVTRRPDVRFAVTANSKYDDKPWEKPLEPIVWRAFTPENLKSPSFSATAVYFALTVHDAIRIPVGLVGVYQGATGIDCWTPPYEGQPERTKDRASCQPRVYWNTVVNPWAPFAARGMIWYQGEHDAKDPVTYAAKLRRLYDGWRTRFENPGLRFYYAQLCSWGSNIAPFQEAQATFERDEPNAAMAVICDVCNLTDIHPNDKEPVGRRLALHAIRRDYGKEFGFENVQDNSPSFAGFTVTGSVAIVSVQDAKSLHLYNPDFSKANGFELAGVDGVWKPAKILNLREDKAWGSGEPVWKGPLKGPDILLGADGLDQPVRVRYLHSKPWHGNLYNEANLPMGPFQAGLDLPCVSSGRTGTGE